MKNQINREKNFTIELVFLTSYRYILLIFNPYWNASIQKLLYLVIYFLFYSNVLLINVYKNVDKNILLSFLY